MKSTIVKLNTRIEMQRENIARLEREVKYLCSCAKRDNGYSIKDRAILKEAVEFQRRRVAKRDKHIVELEVELEVNNETM